MEERKMNEYDLIEEFEEYLKENVESLEELKTKTLRDGFRDILRKDILASEKRLELCDELKRKLKALELIKKYDLRPSDFHDNETHLCLAEEEYKLLKEVL